MSQKERLACSGISKGRAGNPSKRAGCRWRVCTAKPAEGQVAPTEGGGGPLGDQGLGGRTNTKPLGFRSLRGWRSNRSPGGRSRYCLLGAGCLGIVYGLRIHQPAHQRAKQRECQEQEGPGKKDTSAKRPAAKTSHQSRSCKVIQTRSIVSSYRHTRASRWGQRSRKRTASSVPQQPIYYAEKLRPFSLSGLARRHECRL